MKTITTYELLEMVKDGKELPKKGKYCDTIFENKDGDLLNDINCSLFEHKGDGDEKLLSMLNDEIEIIEEKEIPEKIEYYDDSIAWVIDGVGQLSDVDKVIIDKLNNVIDYLKSREVK